MAEIEFVVQAYQFEPNPRPNLVLEDSDDEDNIEDDDEEVQPGPPVVEWCECQQCVAMPTRRESLCCHKHSKCVPMMEAVGVTCITQHPGFEAICINRYSVEVSFLEFLDDYGEYGDDQQVHETYRYVSYRKFTRWTWRKLKRYDRRVIPSCAVNLIHQAFPSEQYAGFRYARQ